MTDVNQNEQHESATFVEEVGHRLRAIRRQQGLSLEDVEERSGGRWSASAVGAYERGYRVLSLARLRELAEFYGVPMSVVVGEVDLRVLGSLLGLSEPKLLERLAGWGVLSAVEGNATTLDVD